MAAGNTFNRRLAGNVLKKATGLEGTDGKMGPDYAFIELDLVPVHEEDNVLILAPEADPNICKRVMIIVNPMIAKIGNYNHQQIVEAGDNVMVIIHNPKEFDLSSLEWGCRIYVLR